MSDTDAPISLPSHSQPPTPAPSPCLLYRAGRVSYWDAWDWQKKLTEARRENAELPDVLLLLEHPPVYTLGRGADEKFVKLTAHHLPIVRVERGGEVTHHCPGQLVGYPILNLKRHQPDLHWYLRQLEDVIIRTLAHHHIRGERQAGLTGVWVEGQKVAAIGIKVTRWITMHGFSLNVRPDLSGFQHIVPCGIADRPVGSLQNFNKTLTIEAVQSTLEHQFEQVFSCQLIAQSSPTPFPN